MVSNLAAGTAARGRIAFAPLTWGAREHAAALGTFDLVVCSDCLYREVRRLQPLYIPNVRDAACPISTG